MKPRCYLCDCPATEQDHFPIPKALGGLDTLPICRGCHDAKDRIALGSWDPLYTWEALRGLWGKATLSERLVLAKMISVAAHARHSLEKKEAS